MGADMRGGRGRLTRLKSKRPSCNLNAIIHPQHPLTPPQHPPTLQSVFAAAAVAARRNQAGVSSSSPARPEQRWGGVGWDAPLMQAPLTCPAFFIGHYSAGGAERGKRGGNFNSTPEWRLSYNQCIQGRITGCHWDSITWGGGVNGILTPVKGGMAIGGLELNSSLHRR